MGTLFRGSPTVFHPSGVEYPPQSATAPTAPSALPARCSPRMCVIRYRRSVAAQPCTRTPPPAGPIMRFLSNLWFWCRTPFFFVADLPRLGQVALALMVVAVLAGGWAAVRHEKQQRAARRTAVVW